jgi:hypothetical protein
MHSTDTPDGPTLFEFFRNGTRFLGLVSDTPAHSNLMPRVLGPRRA